MSTNTERTNRFNELAEAYSTDLYRYAMWICGNDALAKDLVQETFLRAWRALDSLKDKGKVRLTQGEPGSGFEAFYSLE